jgi:hypothetical protein
MPDTAQYLQEDRWDEAAAGPERRQSPRFALLIQAAKLIADGREYLCVVRDASAEGLKIRHFNHLPESENFDIELSNGELFPVSLVWRDAINVGVRFRNEEDFDRIVSPQGGRKPFRKLRLNVEASAEICWGGWTVPVSILNLSREGAAIECDQRLSRDQLVRLEIGGLKTIYAKVRWRRGTRYGLVFENTFSFEELAATLVRLNSKAA